MLTLSDPEVRALAAGECVVVFVRRGSVDEGDEIELAGNGPLDPARLKPAYRRWATLGPPQGRWSAVVDAVEPAAILDPIAGASRHILDRPGEGDVVVLRVYGPEGPVLGDDAYEARRRSVTGAFTQ
jgi:hypothetical protein